MERYKCKRCGEEFDELARHTYREDWGDIDTVKCPKCGAVLWEGIDFDELFEELK